MDVNMVSEGKSLLGSDDLSDITIVCQEREWKLHKVILAERSRWFRKALCGPFCEADTKVIRLDEEDPNALDIAIKWIYCQGLPDEQFNNESTLYEAYVVLGRCARFLLVDDLHTLCLKKVKDNCFMKMIWFQHAYLQTEDNKKQMEPEDIEGFFQGAHAAFETKQEDMQQMFMSAITDAHYWMVPDEAFREMCKLTPDFGVRVLGDFANALIYGHHNPNFKPRRCAFEHSYLGAKGLEEERKLSLDISATKKLLDECTMEGVRFNLERELEQQLKKLERLEGQYWARLGRTSKGRLVAYCSRCVVEVD